MTFAGAPSSSGKAQKNAHSSAEKVSCAGKPQSHEPLDPTGAIVIVSLSRNDQ